MEVLKCPNHSDSFCILKTGLKEGPKKGVSFYVCSQCKYFKETKLPPVTCTVHPDNVIDVQALILISGKLWRNFRCLGRDQGKTWCGLEAMPKTQNQDTSLSKGSKDKRSHQSPSISNRKHDQKMSPQNMSKEVCIKEKREGSVGDKTEEPTSSPSEPDSAFNDGSIILYSDEDDDDKDTSDGKAFSAGRSVILCSDEDEEDDVKDTSDGKALSLGSPMGGSGSPLLISDDEDDHKNVPNNRLKLASKKSASPALLIRDKNNDADIDNTPVSAGKMSSRKSPTSGLPSKDGSYGKPQNLHAKDKESSLKSTAHPKSSLQSFSDLSKSQHQSLPANGKLEKFQDKSFKQYRESPAPVKLNHKQQSKRRDDNSSSDSDDDVVEVKQAEKLLQNLNISGEMKMENQPQNDNSSSQNISHMKAPHDSKPSVYPTKRSEREEGMTLENKELPSDVAKNVSSQSKTGYESINETESVSLLTIERNQYKSELAQVQASIKSVRLDLLPDRGQRLHDKIKRLQEKISCLDERLAKASLHTGVNRSETSGPQIIKVYPGQAGHKSIHVPENKQHLMVSKPSTASSNHSQVITVPPHILQQLYSANPQAMTLYGGRMTAQRLFEVGTITTEAITKLHKQLETCPDASEESSDPAGLRVSLMPHQRHALSWLDWREQQHPPCGVLADDMGLGKTLTMISHVLKQKQTREATSEDDTWMGKQKQLEKLNKAMKKSRATLIIAPASLVHQWAKEIDKRCQNGVLKYLIYHGPNRETRIHRLIDHDIVITSYAIVSREVGADKNSNVEKSVQDQDEDQEADVPEYKSKEDLPLLLRIGWERVILDEAHEIKNHKSIKAQAVSRLRAAYRWALTGTPIQNDLKDMYSLLRFLRFSPFDEFKVWKKQIESAQGSTKRLNTIVKALLLRRTKGDCTSNGQPLVKLPSKDYHTIHVELGPEEKTIYEKLFRKTLSTVREYVRRHQDGTGNRGMSNHYSEPQGAVGGKDPSHYFPGASFPTNTSSSKRGTGSQILVSLLRLRQCCCHLSLMKSHIESETLESDGIELSLEEQMKGMLLDDLLETKEPKEASLVQQTSSLLEKSSDSTKLKCVMNKIRDIKTANPGDKCVIVSQWTSMLEVVAIHLKKEGIRYSLIQGSIPAKKRGDIIDDFNSSSGDAQIILVSLRAGGVGLNLIGGNHLFLIDSHWNPALEEQACDRIYRLGQKKDVSIYRFLCKDTIEEKISTLQEGKLRLAKSVLTGSTATSQKLSLDDLRLLFGV